MKRYIKFICIVIVTILLCITLANNTCYAAHTQGTDGAGVAGGGQQEENVKNSPDPILNPDFYAPANKGGNTLLIGKGNEIIGAIRVIGTVVAVLSIMVIGIRYMMGSTEEKANYKETMIPYLIGAIMLFAIPNILGVIYDLVKEIKF